MPNLLFLYTDEQRTDTMAAYGNCAVATPALDRLARESVVFERCYCTQPVCTPARGSIVTGLFPHAHGAVTNNVPLLREAGCLPEMLPEGGYVAGHFGKWHLGDEIYPQHGFTDWRATEDTYHATYLPPHEEWTPERSAYHRWLVSRGVRPRERNASLPPERRHRAYENRFFRDQIHSLPEEHSRPAFLANEAVSFIEEHARRPWVLYVNFLEPHPPFMSARDGQYRPEDVTLPEAWTLELGPDVPLRLRIGAAGARRHGRNAERALREVVARYWGMVSLVDAHVGRILDALEREGLAGDTIVVFTSDHGDMMGSHGLHGKSCMFDEAACVPLLVRLPGSREQRRVAAPVSQVDLVPTLLDLMGHEAPAYLHGESLRDVLEGRAASPGRDVFMEWHPDRPEGGAPSPLPDWLRGVCTAEEMERARSEEIRTVVTQDLWKLSVSSAGDHELYDLGRDPLETRNLVREPDAKGRVADLASRVRAWQERTGDGLELQP